MFFTRHRDSVAIRHRVGGRRRGHSRVANRSFMHDFRLGGALVRPRLNEIHVDGQVERLPPKFIDVLMLLAEKQGTVVGKQELLKRVWNDPQIGEDSLTNAIWMLRRTLGDDARRPAYIATVPRRGYRLLADVEVLPGGQPIQPEDAVPLEALDSSPPEPYGQAQPRGQLASLESVVSPPSRFILLPTAVAAATRRRHRWHPLMSILLALGTLLLATAISRHTVQPSARVFPFRTGGQLGSIAVDTEGSALIGDAAGGLYALDTRLGVERWRAPSGTRIPTAPAQFAGAIYFGTDDGYLYALDVADGNERWRFRASAPVHTVPAVDDQRVIFADIAGGVQALDRANARPLWTARVGARTQGSVLGRGEVALVRAVDGNITAFDSIEGKLRWQRRFDGPLSDLVALGGERCVFASTVDGIHAVNATDGSTRWHVDLAAAEDAPLVVGSMVYALGRYGDLLALRADDGSLQWRAHLDIGDTHSLLWWQDRIVVVLDGGVVGVIDPVDGHIVRRIALNEPPDLLAVDGGRLLVALQSGRMLALDRVALNGLDAVDLDLDVEARLRQREASQNSSSIEVLQSGASPPQQLWRTRVVGQVHDIGVAEDATLYFGDEHATMALSAAGEVRWRASVGFAQASALALDEQHLYLGRRDHAVYALNRHDGSQRWRFETGAAVMAAPVLDAGRVFVGSDDQNFYALNVDDGSVLWSFRTQRPIRGTAVVGAGMVLFGGADRHVYARDARTGAARWQFEASDWIVAQPVIAGDRVFVGVGNGDLHALDLHSGSELWRFHAGGKIWFRPAFDAQRVFFGSGDGHIYALDQKTGVEQWRFRTGASAEGSVELADGVLYAGSHDFHLYALEQDTGRPLWRMRTGGSVFNPRVVDGRLYVASADQYLYALRLPTAPTPARAEHKAGGADRPRRAIRVMLAPRVG